MAGTGIEVRIESPELERLRKRLLRWSAAVRDRSRLLVALGAEVESQVRRRISEDKKGPDGEVWPPWSERYAATRRGGHSLLESEGDLLESITTVVEQDQVEVGTNLVYGAIHQFGGAEVDMPIPARPYLGLGPRNVDDLEAVLDDWIDDRLEASAQ